MRLTGCATYAQSDYVDLPFSIGATVYSIAESKKGMVRKIVIKNYRIIKKSGVYIVQLFDTTNRIWFSNELCDIFNATTYAENYYLSQIAKVKTLDCPPI